MSSHELIAILMEEDRHRKSRNGESSSVALQVRASGRQKGTINPKKDEECFNCRKKGNISNDVIVGRKEEQRRARDLKGEKRRKERIRLRR